ncbi:uncharacterized protein [Hetaerina americana]|uniref:uncharacterized protein isoform X2 n=1 Tax=Hetaerina americana TaxID=62018 RepID=UPI003A7F3C11
MRRSALTNGTTGALASVAASAGPGRRRWEARQGRSVRWAAGIWLLLTVAASTSSAASPQWTGPEDFTDGFRNPYEGTPLDGLHYDGDVTPEDYVIDQITAYLQRAGGRTKSRQEQQQLPSSSRVGVQQLPGGEDEDEEETGGGYEDALEEEGLLPPPPPPPKGPAREGHGLGFTYRFPERVEQADADRTFAVNPSDPKYYTATVIGRSGQGDRATTWDSIGENEARELEGGGPPERPRPIRPLGRFPKVKPIQVISTTGTEIPPIHGMVEMMNVPRESEGADGEDKADLRISPPASSHESAGSVPLDSTDGGSSVPAEQVKRERPDQVPLNFGSDAYLTAIISGCTAAAVVGVLAFAIFWYRLQRNAKAAADVEYPAYGVTGPNQEASAVAAAAAAASAVSPTPHSGGSTSPLTSGDRRLAQSAQMYHYQHQKQQIIAMERASNERRGSVSEVDSEEENEEGDYTVYECPGLAPTGEMEVKNPLFHDDPTPATPSGGNNNGRDRRGENGSGKP